MKKIIVFVLLLIISARSFSQPNTNPVPTVKTDYLKKSSYQKFAAWVLFGGGAAVLIITGLSNVGIDFVSPKKSFSTAPVGIGALCMASSIPLFIASHRNKKKSMGLSFKNDTTPQIQKSSFVYRFVPSLALRISL